MLALALAGCASVEPPPPAPITDAEMRAIVATLSSDEFAGRMPGTPGGDRTVAYIAERFRAAGLVSGSTGGAPFLEPFTVKATERKLPADAKLPAGQRYFTEQINKAKPFTSWNVVGRVPGRRPDGKIVVVMGHWDHLGTCMPEGSPDRICNGAVDNASGIAAMIAVAERVARLRLDRDVWFIATSAEEWGLLGAKALAEKPPFALSSIIAGFNLDTIAIASKGAPVAIVAPEGSRLEPLVRAAAQAVGRAWDGDDEADPFIQRQDGWAFSQRGAPVIMAGGSFSNLALLQKFLGAAYHGPEDELRADTDLGGAVDDANLHVELVRRAASRGHLPSFAGIPKVARR